MLINKISVPSTITLQKPHLSKPIMIELPIAVRVTPLDFVDKFDRNMNYEVYEIDIFFISDLEDMTFSHYMVQPKSMLCRKLVEILLKKTLGSLIVIGFQIVLDI